jgi:nucleoid-associated protein EbfC
LFFYGNGRIKKFTLPLPCIQQSNTHKKQLAMFDMMKMMGKMKEVQARMKEAQDNLVHVRAHGESGAGLVKATVNGKRQLIALDVDPSLLKAEDKMVLQDLIIAAVNKAAEEAEVAAKEELKKSTDGLLPNIPGIDLSSLMG